MVSDMYDAWERAQDIDPAVSIPKDVADAARHYSTRSSGGSERIVEFAPCTGNVVNTDVKCSVYKVKERGTVMCFERGAIALPVGLVQDVVDHVCENTDCVVTYISDSEHYDPEEGDEL